MDQLRQHLLGDVFAGDVSLKDLLRGHDDLIRCFAATTFATHAVCHQSHDTTFCAWVWEQDELVLLVRPVSSVDAGGGNQSKTGSCCIHGKTIMPKSIPSGSIRARVIPCSRVQGRHQSATTMSENLHSPQRQLIELRMEHADLDNLIDRAAEQSPVDELSLRRLKKRRLLLRDQIAALELLLDPKEPA